MGPARTIDRIRAQRSLNYLSVVLGCLLAFGITSCEDLGSPEEIPSRVATDVVIEIEIRDIPGFPTSLRIEDSLGRATASVRAGEPLWVRYTAVNHSGKSLTWSTGMTYPFARFLIKLGADTLANSFWGLAFLAIPVDGVVANGDSLTALWRLDPAKYPLNPGFYTAVAMPTYVIGMTQMPEDEIAAFSVIP